MLGRGYFSRAHFLLGAVLIFCVYTLLWYQSKTIYNFASGMTGSEAFGVVSVSEASSSLLSCEGQMNDSNGVSDKMGPSESINSRNASSAGKAKAAKPNFGGWRCSASPLGVSSWRDVIPSLVKDLVLNEDGDIYQFGVFDGGSMSMFRKFFPSKFLWGFDSFQGLPETKKDHSLGDWDYGAYKSTFTPESLLKKLCGPTHSNFVVGFYDTSLTKDLRKTHNMPQAFYIDMDADLYISSIQALEWIFTSGLARVGTLIGYDDWWVLPCARGGEKLLPLDTSVGKAHVEITIKHKVRFRCVAGPCTFMSCTRRHCCWGPIFIVEGFGGDTVPDTGFHMSSKEVVTWKKKNLECIRVNRGWRMDVALSA